MKFPFRKSTARPAAKPRAEGRRSVRDVTAMSKSGVEPAGLQPVTGNLFSTTLDGQDFFWLGANRAAFYRYMRDHIPIISSAIWSWVHLCSTPQRCVLTGSESEKEAARAILDDLDRRIFENPFTRRPGITHLTELFFLELFTTGRFAGEIVPLADGSGIDYFQTIDPDILQWKRDGRWTAYFEDESDQQHPLDPARFFYATLENDMHDPRGIEPLASIPFVGRYRKRSSSTWRARPATQEHRVCKFASRLRRRLPMKARGNTRSASISILTTPFRNSRIWIPTTISLHGAMSK